MMRATSYFNHLLDQEVGADLDGRQALVGRPIPKLAVAIVAPGIHDSICTGGHTHSQLREETAGPQLSSQALCNSRSNLYFF